MMGLHICYRSCDGEDHDDDGVRQKTSTEKGHGRIEERHYSVSVIPESMKHMTTAWANSKSIGQVVNLSEDSRGNDSYQVRYYLSSRPVKVAEFDSVTPK